MDCERVSLLIEEFYDGEMDLHLKSRVEEHIAGCALCNAEFHKVLRLDQILERSSAPPPPSAMLDRKLMEAFQRQNQKDLTSPVWWQRIFIGSVSIPKPAFAAALIMIAFAVTAANIAGRFAVISSDASTISPVASPVNLTPLPPEVIETTKIVEVPIVKERIVTRIVYIERQSNEAVKSQKATLAQNQRGGNKQKEVVNEDNTNLAMNGSIVDGGYVTRANLNGFQPTAELKTRIIGGGKTDEK